MKIIRKVVSVPQKLLHWFRNLSWKKKTLVIIIAIVLISIIIGQITALTAPPGYTLAKAERKDITEIVSETGNIATNGSVQVYSPTNGVVSEVYVANGDIVSEGQDLLKIESTATEQEQSSAYANYLTASATLNAAKSNLNSLRATMYSEWDDFRNLATNDTYETGDGTARDQNREAAEFQIAQDSWLAAEAKYKDQQTVVSQASAQVSSTWLLYQATQNATVKATTNGTVANLSAAVGSNVAIQTLTTTPKPILTIANFSTTELILSLSESDIAKVKEGQRAEIDVSAVNDKTYDGIVRRADTVGTNELGVIRYNVYIEITNPDSNLRPGMTADVEVVTNEIKNTLAVPNSSIKPYQGGRAVRIIDKKTKEVTYIPVKIGVRGQENTQILSGINEGQEVVTSLSNEKIQRPGLF